MYIGGCTGCRGDVLGDVVASRSDPAVEKTGWDYWAARGYTKFVYPYGDALAKLGIDIRQLPVGTTFRNLISAGKITIHDVVDPIGIGSDEWFAKNPNDPILNSQVTELAPVDTPAFAQVQATAAAEAPPPPAVAPSTAPNVAVLPAIALPATTPAAPAAPASVSTATAVTRMPSVSSTPAPVLLPDRPVTQPLVDVTPDQALTLVQSSPPDTTSGAGGGMPRWVLPAAAGGVLLLLLSSSSRRR